MKWQVNIVSCRQNWHIIAERDEGLGMAMISVIVAVYNAEKYLRQCLDSIICQTYRDLEIICVNDGSVDASSEILEEYADQDRRIRIFTKENEGLGGASARNLGLEKATGEYVSILDSDDFFEPEMLEKAFCKAQETEADIIVFGGYEYDHQRCTDRRVESILKDRVVPMKRVFSYKDCPDSIFQLSQGMAWNKLYRRSFLDTYGLRFQKIKYTDDAYFTFSHMVLAEKIAVVCDGLVHYRVNSGTNQTSGISDYPDSSYLPYIKLKESLINWGIYQEVKRSFINCAAVFIRYCYDMINRYDAFVYLHEKLRSEVFDLLDISKCGKEVFDDWRTAQWVVQVCEHSAGELLFLAARGYGSADSTTGILRFQFPYDRIPGNSRIALIGERLLGRNYYAQAVLSGYCDIALWAGRENPQGYSYIKSMDGLRGSDFDRYLIAYSEQDKIRECEQMLEKIGVEKAKIVIGGQQE